MRSQITLRLSAEELAALDAAAARLRVDRATLIRASALGMADLVLATAPPLVLMAEPAELLSRAAARLAAAERGAASAAEEEATP